MKESYHFTKRKSKINWWKEKISLYRHTDNSIRAICKYLFNLDEKNITKLEIPTGNPLLISFKNNTEISNCTYLDHERAKDLIVF